MTTLPDYYELLQVSQNADSEVIQAAYQRLVHKWQSDRRPGDSSAFERLSMLDGAHAVLSDPVQRQEYDWQRRQVAPSETGEGQPPFANRESPTPPTPATHPPGETSPNEQGPTPRKTVSPAAWILFSIGMVLFLVHQRLDPLSFLMRALVWGLIFGVPAYLCYREKKRSGVTVAATLFFLAAGSEVAVEVYATLAFQSRTNERQAVVVQTPAVDTPLEPRLVKRARTAKECYDSGHAWFEKREYDKAIVEFDEAIQLDPQPALSYHYRGLALLEKLRRGTPAGPSRERSEYEKAIKDFSEAIQRDPNRAESHYYRGVAWQNNITKGGANYDEAIKNFNEAIRLDQRHSEWYHERGFCWYIKRYYEEAIWDYTQAIQLNPNDSSSYHYRGQIWLDKKKYDKAIEDFSACMKIRQDGDDYCCRGLAWLGKENYDQAIRDFDKSIHLYSEQSWCSSEPYHYRGLAWASQGEYHKAFRDYDEAYRLNPNYSKFPSKDPFVDFAWLLATCPDATIRDGKRAIRLATAGYQRHGCNNHAIYLDALAAAYAEDGQFGEAVQNEIKALDNPDNPAALREAFRQRLNLYKRGIPYRQSP